MTTVLEYFADTFPHHPLDMDEAKSLQDMPLDSVCGAMCQKAIRSGDDLYELLYGEALAEEVYQVAEAVLQLVLIYING